LFYFVKEANTDLCYDSLNSVYMCVLALLILGIAFGLASYGSSNACNILNKIKNDEASHESADMIRSDE